jgi:hypothetical protein
MASRVSTLGCSCRLCGPVYRDYTVYREMSDGGGGGRCAAVVPHVELTATFSSCSYYRKTERRRILVFLDNIFNLLRRPEIDSKKSVPPAYVTWRAGTIEIIIKFQHCQGFLHENCHVFYISIFKETFEIKTKGTSITSYNTFFFNCQTS